MASSTHRDIRNFIPNRKKLTRLGSFSSREVFCTWAKDSLLKPSTIKTLMEDHEVDCLPAVLALRGRDINNLGLSIGQARLFEEAVAKLHAEYKYKEPLVPETRVDVEFPKYKSLLDETEGLRGDDVSKRKFSYTYINGKDQLDGSKLENSNVLHEDNKGTEENLLSDRADDDETQSGCACERWLFITIFMPVILVISLLGVIAWIILWPINRFCKVGKPFPEIYKTADRLMKSPAEACRWVVGRKERNLESSQEKTKHSYGGTDNIEIKELDRTT